MTSYAKIALAAGGAAAVLAGLGYTLSRPHADDFQRAEAVYVQKCAYCHDLEGSIGVELDARVVRSYGSARRLFNYLRIAMPYDAPRTMPDEDVWLTVSYLVRSRGLAPGEVAIDERNADRITF